MINCHKEILKFYDQEVRLGNIWEKLGRYGETNKKKLVCGLNAKKDLPRLEEYFYQGSYVMCTTIKHDENDYDIDIGVVFLKDDLKGTNGGDKSALDTRKMIAEIMQDDRFKNQPKVLKNCVRIYYNEGHHVDMAIYRIDKNGKQELASSDWEESNPKAITNWFKEEVKKQSPDSDNGQQLRRVVRLLKKWSKSRKSWNMPSGLILTILAVECYQPTLDRDDDAFFRTIMAIKDRLNKCKIVKNPINKAEITSSEKHKNRVQFLYDTLEECFDDVLNLQSITTKKEALFILRKFFNNDFFETQIEKIQEAIIVNPDTRNQPWHQ